MSGKLSHIFFVIIFVVVGSFFRLYALPSIPPSPSLDEASIGWNAYSILKTGKDEYGNYFPWVLRAYDDWRPGIYVYTVIPFITLFGLDVVSVRLPSALLSIVCLLGIYGIGREMFRKKSDDIPLLSMVVDVPLIATALFAISPWHIYLSRLGHETNFGFFLVLFGLYFFLRAIRLENSRMFILSCLSFGLSLHAYQSQKVVVPLLVVGLFFLHREHIRKKPRMYLAGILLFTIFFVKMIMITFSEDGLARVRGTSIFHIVTEKQILANGKFTLAKQNRDLVGQILNHRSVVQISVVFDQYIRHFDPKWLFFGNTRENHKVPNVGLLYWWESIFILTGLIFIRKISNNLTLHIVILVILVSVIPGSVTTQAPHAMRTYTMLLGLILLASTGVVSLIRMVKNERNKYISYILFLCLYLYGIFQLSHNYFLVFPNTQSDSFQYAASEALNTLFVTNKQILYDRVVISNEKDLYQSYMFYMFVTNYDPMSYLSSGGTVSGGFAQKHRIENIEFRPIEWEKDKQQSIHTLFIGNVDDFPSDVAKQYSFADKDGKIKIVVIDNQL